MRWDRTLMDEILSARQQLEDLGMVRPSIRSVLYFLMEHPPWEKKHYDPLTVKLGEWRDDGLIPWGLFADDGAGMHYRPLTTTEIRERIKSLEGMVPAVLLPDGSMRFVFCEHIGLVDTLSSFLDDMVPVVSSQGQLRREHLVTFMNAMVHAAEELGAKTISGLSLVDWDEAGKFIYNAHRDWMKRIFKIPLEHYAVTTEQLRAVRLPVHEDHQLDGVIGRNPPLFKRQLRAAIGLRH